MSDPRRLPYSLNHVLSVIQANGVEADLDISSQFYFSDQGTPETLFWQVSLEDWTKVFSALNFGADLAYPETAQEVISIFLRMVTDVVDLCALIQECIETSESLQQTLNQYMSANNPSGTNPDYTQALPASVMANNVIPADALCTDGNKYAMSLAIVRELDRLVTDFFQIVEAATNPNEIAAQMVSSIPVFGGLASLALEVADDVQEGIAEVYAAAYNATTELNFACAIYCAFDDCALSWDSVIGAYYSVGSIPAPPTGDFTAFLQWFIDLALSTDDIIVGAAHLFVLEAMKYGSSFFGSGVFTTLLIELENAKDESITVPEECECFEPTFMEFGVGTCSPRDVCGTNLIQQSEFVWRATSTEGNGGNYVTWQRSDGGDFKLTSRALVSGVNPFYWVWQTAAGTCGSGNNPPNLSTTFFKHIGIGGLPANVWTMDFTFAYS